ncbi:MAG: ATP-binding cassette domain-containing protein [Leeuwenhoekiella sp.]
MNHFAINTAKTPISETHLRQLQSGHITDDIIWEGKGLLFSELEVQRYLDEEYRHDEFVITSGGEDKLQTKSSGERKKALLEYQLKQNPDLLILDNPFDMLDQETVKTFRAKLRELADTVNLVLIYRQLRDLLGFIDHLLIIDDSGKFKVTKRSENGVRVGSRTVGIPPLREMSEQLGTLPEELIAFKKVSVKYGDKPVLDSIDWTIKKGEFWYLVGPNGSGKTTMLSMIFGNNPKGYGKELYIFGRKKGSGESVWEIKKKIGYFTTNITERFTGTHTVLDMVISGLHDSVGLYRKVKESDRQLAKQWLQVIELEDKSKQRFIDLPEVEKRLVLIARAMIKQPPLLILDEPTAALDDQGAMLVLGLIHAISLKTDCTILYVSHRLEKGIEPDFVFQLQAGENGSTGLVHKVSSNE